MHDTDQLAHGLGHEEFPVLDVDVKFVLDGELHCESAQLIGLGALVKRL